MVSSSASSTYVWPKPHMCRYVNNNINAIYMLEMWELEDILNDRRMFVKLLPQKNDF